MTHPESSLWNFVIQRSFCRVASGFSRHFWIFGKFPEKPWVALLASLSYVTDQERETLVIQG